MVGIICCLALLSGLMMLTGTASAASVDDIDTGDTAWIITATALVFIMTPAIGFFYGGMLRKQSLLSIMGQTIIIIAIVTLTWVIVGYSIAFSPDVGGLIGGLDHAFLNGVGAVPNSLAPTIPSILFMVFQMVFAIITVALLIGSVAERMKLKALCIFLAIWSVVVYAVVAHWVWGGGWIFSLGALDFAGGTVVHIAGGVSALAIALALDRHGKRISVQNHREEQPSNIPYVVLGGALLWMGWFGFNGGSALSSSWLAANALVMTQVAGATAAGVWGLISYYHLGRVSVLGLVTGGIAGLVAITPAAGFVDIYGALIIGAGVAPVCYGAIQLRKRLGFDDALDVWGCHGVGGTFGAICVGLFATTSINPAAKDGLLYGGGIDLMVNQIIAVAGVWLYVFVASFAIMWVLGKIMPIRMTKEEEVVGADIVQHGENAYA
jgi:Amt family ammonium transporter